MRFSGPLMRRAGVSVPRGRAYRCAVRKLESLQAWTNGRQLAREAYALTLTAPGRCLRIALGSAAELRTHLDLVVDLGLLEGGAIAAVRARCDREVGLLIGLMRSLDGGGP